MLGNPWPTGKDSLSWVKHAQKIHEPCEIPRFLERFRRALKYEIWRSMEFERQTSKQTNKQTNKPKLNLGLVLVHTNSISQDQVQSHHSLTSHTAGGHWKQATARFTSLSFLSWPHLNWWDEKFDQVTSFSKEAKRGFTCVSDWVSWAKKTAEGHLPNCQTAIMLSLWVSFIPEEIRFDEVTNRAFNVKISQRSERKSFQRVASGRVWPSQYT